VISPMAHRKYDKARNTSGDQTGVAPKPRSIGHFIFSPSFGSTCIPDWSPQAEKSGKSEQRPETTKRLPPRNHLARKGSIYCNAARFAMSFHQIRIGLPEYTNRSNDQEKNMGGNQTPGKTSGLMELLVLLSLSGRGPVWRCQLKLCWPRRPIIWWGGPNIREEPLISRFYSFFFPGDGSLGRFQLRPGNCYQHHYTGQENIRQHKTGPLSI